MASALLVFGVIAGGAVFIYFQYQRAIAPAVTTTEELDSDADGLKDTEEVRYSTDPTNPDTDSDGYLDGEEVRNGYDPRTPAALDGSRTTPDTTPQVQALPTSSLVSTVDTTGWKTFGTTFYGNRLSFLYPPTWTAQVGEATQPEVFVINPENDILIRLKSRSDVTLEQAAVEYTGQADTNVTATSINGADARKIVQGKDANTTYLIADRGLVYTLELPQGEIDEVKAIISSLSVNPTDPTLPAINIVYQISEVVDAGTSSLPEDDTVEHRFVRVGADNANPSVVFTVTKKNNDGNGPVTAVPYGPNSLLIYRRTQGPNDIVYARIDGTDAGPATTPVTPSIAFTADKRLAATVNFDSTNSSHTLLLHDVSTGQKRSVTLALQLNETLYPVVWSTDQTRVYLSTTPSRPTRRVFSADTITGAIEEVSIIKDLGIKEIDIHPDLNRAIGVTSTISPDPRIGSTPPSSIESISLSQKTNTTLLQSDTSIFRKTLLSPNGLFLAYETYQAGIVTTSVASITSPSQTIATFSGTLLDWTPDSASIIYKTTKQIRVSKRDGVGDTALITDSVDNPLGADPYSITYIGIFGEATAQ